MSGHSKWSQIKRSKGAADVRRAKVFTQLAKAITVAARLGKNLDTAIDAAKSANMPKDNIDRAIKRGTGELGDGVQIEEVLYEAYGPGGAALLIPTLTDSRNRMAGDLRAIANKFHITLAQPGAVRFLFQERGILEVELGSNSEETQLLLIDCGIDDIDVEDDRLVGYCSPDQISRAKNAVELAHLKILESRIGFVPKLLHNISQDDQEQLIKTIEVIEELEDVNSVGTNARFID